MTWFDFTRGMWTEWKWNVFTNWICSLFSKVSECDWNSTPFFKYECEVNSIPEKKERTMLCLLLGNPSCLQFCQNPFKKCKGCFWEMSNNWQINVCVFATAILVDIWHWVQNHVNFKDVFSNIIVYLFPEKKNNIVTILTSQKISLASE